MRPPELTFVRPAALLAAALITSAPLLTSCASPRPHLHTMRDIQAYHQALTTLPGANPPPGSPEDQRNIQNFARFFGNLTEDNARILTRQTYAPTLFFHDTFKTITSLDQLEHYFIETARNTDSVTARIDDVARSGPDYYIRWTMDIRLKKFQRGRTLRSVGITHLRFDEQGRILLHHDYWDSAAGFYQYVPLLGPGIRWIRSLF